MGPSRPFWLVRWRTGSRQPWALDVTLKLSELCDCGNEAACDMIGADDALKTRIGSAAEKLQGTCLYVSESGVAVRTQGGHVADVSLRASPPGLISNLHPFPNASGA